MSDVSQIDGQSVRRKRESLGWAVTDMATMACLSSKQIRQIEEGGLAAFYSENVKLTAARKVAGLLQMTDAELFGQVAPQVVEQPTDYSEPQVQEEVFALPVEPENSSQKAVQSAALSRGEALHFFAQPPEDTSQTETLTKKVEAPAEPVATDPVQLDSTSEEIKTQDTEAETNNSGYLLKIFALFLVAIAAAALLKPHYVDEKTESSNSESQAQPVSSSPVPAPEPESASNANAQATAPNAVNAVQVPPASDQSKSNNSFTFITPASPVQATTDIPASATAK